MTGITLCEISSGLSIEGAIQSSRLDQVVDVTLRAVGAVGDVEWITQLPNTGGMPYLGTFDVLPPHLSLSDNGDGTATITGTRDIWLPEDAPARALSVIDGAGQKADLMIRWATEPKWPIVVEGPRSFTVVAGQPFSKTYTFAGAIGSRIAGLGGVIESAGLTLTDNHDNTVTLSGTVSIGSSPRAQFFAQYEQGGAYPYMYSESVALHIGVVSP